MQPWRSQRVEGNRQQGSQHTSRSFISTTPFRSANSAQRKISSNGELPIELISSPSRGLDISDSTRDITNHATQSRYRQYISERLVQHRDKYGPVLQNKRDQLFPLLLPSVHTHSRWSAAGIEGKALESLQAVMLLVRTLREGCVAASRIDAFAVDVYALSTFLSLLVGDDIQLSSSLSRLLEMVYNGTTELVGDAATDIQVVVGSYSTSDLSSMLNPGHVAALYLLWLTNSSSQAARIGGVQRESKGPGAVWLQERDRISAFLRVEDQHCQWKRATEEVHAALARNNAVGLREILLKNDLSVWQRAIMRRTIDRVRKEVWNTLITSYLYAPLDSRLFEESEQPLGDDWIERMLFVDLAIMPSPSLPAAGQPESEEVPESWDDSVDGITASLQSTSLQQDASTIQLRASRLASCFEVFQLPPSTLTETPYNGPLRKWIGRRVFQGGKTNFKLR